MKRPLLLLTVAACLHAQGMLKSINNETHRSAAPVTCSGYTYYSTLTLPTPASTLTDFPIVVSGTNADLKTVANGGKVVGTETIATPYSHAVPADFVLKDTDGTTAISNFEFAQYSATAGTYELWINYPSLTTSGGTIYACYGNAAVTTFQGNVNGTWRTAYKVVLHASDGSTLGVKDSTSNGNDGTNTSLTATAAKIDGGAASNGGSSNRIALANNLYTIISNGATHTVSFWVNSTNRTNNPMVFDGATQAAPSNLGAFWELGTATSVAYWGYGVLNYRIYTLTTTWADSTWFYVTLVKTGAGDNGNFYINGTLQTSWTSTMGDPTNIGVTWFTNFGDGVGLPLTGSIDEIRISTDARSANEVAAEYANQNTPATVSAATAF